LGKRISDLTRLKLYSNNITLSQYPFIPGKILSSALYFESKKAKEIYKTFKAD